MRRLLPDHCPTWQQPWPQAGPYKARRLALYWVPRMGLLLVALVFIIGLWWATCAAR